MSLNKINKPIAVGLVLKLEVYTIVHLTNVHALLSCVVFNNELLKEKEGALMVDSLSNLNLCNPEMGSIGLFAIFALLVSDNEFYDKALLQESATENFLLNCKLDLYSARVRLCPHKARINQLNSLQSFDMLETDS